MKYLKIKSCKDCPGNQNMKLCYKYPVIVKHTLYDIMTEYKNSTLSLARDIETYPKIPEWCPLPDYGLPEVEVIVETEDDSQMSLF